jgi:threonine aldolase
MFSVQPSINENPLMEKLKQKGISISSMGLGKLRIVTHLDYREVMHSYVLKTLEKLVFLIY